MLPTRRWAILAGTTCFFAVFAVVLGESTPLFAAGGLAAWLLVAQFDAVRTIRRVDRTLSASASIGSTSVFVGDRTAVTVRASLSTPVDAPIQIELVAPPSVHIADRSQQTLIIDAGEQSGTTTCSVTFPIAGRISFDSLRVTIEDPAGYFTETIDVDVDSHCLVKPPSSEEIHVGQGGRSVGTMFGNHSTDQTGPGLVPHETRQYVMGDTLSRIDWKTTARMNQPYIREFESESDYQLSLVLDSGSHMSTGPAGRTKHDYAREIGLSCIDAAETYGDPLSAQIVDDDGTIWRYAPSASSKAYRRVRDRLLADTPSAEDTGSADVARPVAPGEAQMRAQFLTDDSPFSASLRPFLRETATYISRVSDRPLFEAVKSACADAERRQHLVLVTDDTAKVETYEAVVLASKQSKQTSVFLTPHVLFDRTLTHGGDGFVEFEEFRSRLDALPNVTAYEVAPRIAIERAATSIATVPGES